MSVLHYSAIYIDWRVVLLIPNVALDKGFGVAVWQGNYEIIIDMQ